MQYFFDLDDVQAQEMPGRKRKLVVGNNLMLVFVDREGATEQNHTHDVEQFVLLIEGYPGDQSRSNRPHSLGRPAPA